MKKWSIIWLLIPFLGWSQSEEEKQKIIEQRIEFIGDNLEDSDLDLTTFFDDLYIYLEDPLNINTASFDDFKRLHLLTDIQIQSIINYREKYGELITIYELAAIEELDPFAIEMVLPFVTVQPSGEDYFKWKNAFRYSRQEIMLRYQRGIEPRAGYLDVEDSVLAENPNKIYQGNPDKYYLRYRSRYKDRLSYGFTAEKDPGEEFFKGSQKQGFDFYSAHIYFRKLWKFDAVALGDYQINFGQGLTMWSGFGMGKSSNVFGAQRYAAGIRPYTSVNENQFLRGAAFTLSSDKFDFTAFGSVKRIDANLNETDSTDIFDNSFSSFQTSGYHRTIGELADKQAVREYITGAEIAYHGDHLRIGLASVLTMYPVDLNKDLDWHNQYKFNAGSLLTTGVNYKYFIRKMSFFGETAMSDNGKFGTINGMTWHADPKLDIMAVYRNYDRSFQSLYSVGFGESSDNSGEQGIYLGIQARINKKLNVSAYYDQFQYTWFKWLTDDYSQGREFFIQADVNLSRYSSFYVRFRNKLTERNSKDEATGIKAQEDLIKTNIRLNYDQRINSNLSVQSRIEWSQFDYGADRSNGILIFQDLIFQLPKIPLKLYGRVAVFDAETYDARIYAYENDLLYVFSIPSYYNRGMRTYLMAKYEIGNKVDLWLRWGLWSYQNVSTISSGLEEIDGNRKSDIKAQLKIRL